MLLAIRKACGMFLIAAGVVSIPIPIIPGIPLIAAGAAMLGNNQALVRSGRTWLETRGLLASTTDELRAENAKDDRR
jgi:uncharacterized protein YqgC (DUF456 family)